MNPSYEDITDQIDAKPSWWQEGGVPRWGEFTPHQASSIYAREVVLMEIACQACATKFTVAMCSDVLSTKKKLAEQIVAGTLHYGDPPNTGCCASGPTMNSEPRKILEYWATHDDRHTENGVVTDVAKYFAWNRNPLLEGEYQGWNGSIRPTGKPDPDSDAG